MHILYLNKVLRLRDYAIEGTLRIRKVKLVYGNCVAVLFHSGQDATMGRVTMGIWQLFGVKPVDK